ncbi:unnamed protein product [Dibothriocephalus latus]|uniref:protein-tyrosine-phosphatase n=1 Tax=Dibothriocephalus latus TaxID=60516 RepID=A0A3P7NRZ2_DIBLA|nr:unnamed protein product [Dibothriocephalus latus]
MHPSAKIERLKRFIVNQNSSSTEALTDETRSVVHFHYMRWPDFGVPVSPSSMLNFLWSVRRTGVLDDPEFPCVIHCSAGVGRSGTFVLIDLALALKQLYVLVSGRFRNSLLYNSGKTKSLTEVLLYLTKRGTLTEEFSHNSSHFENEIPV